MIECTHMIDDGLVKIDFADNPGKLYGARISHSLDGSTWQPCAIFRGIDADALLECSFWEWNEAVRFGNLKFNGRPHPVYWNLYLNNLHKYQGTVHLRVELLIRSSIKLHESVLTLKPCRALFLDEWEKWLPETGWKTEEGSLMPVAGANVSPVLIQPGVSGRYRVYFGLRYGILHMHVRVKSEQIRYPFIAERNRPEFQDKYDKEIFWKTVGLKADDCIEISPTPVSVREPEIWPFGAVRYIKMVPEPAEKKTSHANPQWSDKTLALYFEPYSWAFCYGLDRKWQVQEAMSLFREMGANEVHNQIIRFGSRALHYSRIAERHDRGAMMGDDGTYSPGPASMVQSLDILRETIEICRKLNMVHYANAGLTNCYPGTDFEDRISREHPEWRVGNILRYDRPQTREYAAEIAKEFVEWGTDGVSIDCMRYQYYHTEDDLLAFFRQLRFAINEVSGKNLVPLSVRIPAGDITYFRAFETLAREGVVQCVIPSTLFMREPIFSLKPYLKWKDFGCKVFGIIDGWLTHVGSFHNFQLSMNRFPRDIKEDISRFFREGADGIFVYQADNHCVDPFTRTVLDWRKWPATKNHTRTKGAR